MGKLSLLNWSLRELNRSVLTAAVMFIMDGSKLLPKRPEKVVWISSMPKTQIIWGD